jgi:hypothetical protein
MITRRGMVTGGTGAALIAASQLAFDDTRAMADVAAGTGGSARDFGAKGDGSADDTAAIEKTFQAALNGRRSRVMTIPPGIYRVTRPIKLRTLSKGDGNITHVSGIVGHGARILSQVNGGEPVIEIESRAVVRYFMINGLQIQGNGREGHGLSINCQNRGAYFYNFGMRDVVIENCGGDGCSMVGNIFEGQIINSYFRDNKRNGVTFSHGDENTVLSAVHVYGSIFGGNGRCGVEMLRGAQDVGFNGCYFLLNKSYGLVAPSGCTLLSHCGFENNHAGASGFEQGGPGISLKGFGTLVGCTAYSIYNQTHLIRAHASNQVVLVGCTGYGGGKAKGARLASISSSGHGAFTILGCQGVVDREGNVAVFQPDSRNNVQGTKFGGTWNSPDLFSLGGYALWVDGEGRLRIKQGQPKGDQDGKIVGA